MINKDRENFQYRGGDLVLHHFTFDKPVKNSWKIAVKYVGPSSNLQDSGPSQLFIDDTGWNNIERNF